MLSSIVVINFCHLEILFPWKSELSSFERENLKECKYLFDCQAWQPLVCGALVGLLQIPSAYILGNTMGSATSFAALMGQWLRLTSKEETKNKFTHFKKQLNKWYQVGHVVFALFGSLIATIIVIGINKWNLNAFNGVDPISAFIGGFIMVFGARFANGCTMGHGISGTAKLTVGSFVSVAGMFIGGTAAAFITVAAS